MAIFAIYQFDLKEGKSGRSLFPELAEGNEMKSLATYSSREEYFGSFFRNTKFLHLNARKNFVKMEMDVYRCEILAYFEDVVLLTIENNKAKHTIEDKKDIKHPHHPYCHIAIDNRKGHQLLAIERSSAFDGNPERICKILCEGMNYKMAYTNVEISYQEKYKAKTEFWKTVNEIKTLFDDAVNQIRLDFDRKKIKGSKPNSGDMMGMVAALAIKAQTNSSVLFGMGGNEEVKLDEIREDLIGIADVCMRQKEYDLVLRFRKFGLYKYGADIKAQFGVEDSVLEDFSIGKKELEEGNIDGTFGLLQWFDRINKLMDEYEDTTPILQRRLHSHRR